MSQAPRCFSWGQWPAGLWPGDVQLIRGWGGIRIITPVHHCCCTNHPSRHIFPLAVLLCSWNWSEWRKPVCQYSTHRDVLGSSHNHGVCSCATFPSKHCWFFDRRQGDYVFRSPLEDGWLSKRHLSLTLSDIPDRNQDIKLDEPLPAGGLFGHSLNAI